VRVGEAETGTGGDQPDRGIAGRNSSADDEKERDPPGTFFGLGHGADQREAVWSRPRIGFGFETTSDQIDSAIP